MTALAIVAATAGFAILVQAAVIRSLIGNNRQLVRALIARNAHEIVVLDQSDAKAAGPGRPILRIPFSNKPLPVDDDEYEPIPMGL